jgi:hypothetical protein
MVFQQEEVLIRNGYDIGIGVAMATGSPMALGATGAVTAPEVGTGGSGSFTCNYSGASGSRTSGGQRSSPLVKRPTGWSSWTTTFCPAHPLTVAAWPCR